MRAVIQRVKRASVKTGGRRRDIKRGLVVLAAIGKDDTPADVEFIASKTADLRIFSDKKGKFNFSLKDKEGEILAVPQFTLYADCSKGRRPDFQKSAGKKKALEYFNLYVKELKKRGLDPRKGFFGQEMEVEIINDGPVTVILES